MTGTLHEDQYTFLIISRSVLLRMRNVSDKSCRENRNTYFVSTNFFFSFENCTVYEIMWKNIVERGTPQMTVPRMRIACWIPKPTNTHSLLFHSNNGCTTAPYNVTLYIHCVSCQFLFMSCTLLSVRESEVTLTFPRRNL